MPRKLTFLFLLISVFQTLDAQQIIQGQVFNEQEEALAFVNVLINDDPQRGQSTDIDGRFEYADLEKGDRLVFSYLGYENDTLIFDPSIFFNQLKVVLKSKAYQLVEAEVIAGENPAHRIIRKAIEMRPAHHPEEMRSYRCETYNKLIFDWVMDKEGIEELRSREKKGFMGERRMQQFDGIGPSIERQHAMMMESLTEREFLKPGHLQETVLHKRVSGFKHPSFVALANSIQPFSCYDTHIDLLGKKFLNPISKGGTGNYFFNLEDTLFRAQDTIFVIAYHPRKGTTFDGLKGILHIHTNGYAIQSMIGEPSEPGSLTMKIEQRYQLVDGHRWFPDQLNFELCALHYPDKFMGMKISGRSYIHNVAVDAGLKLRDFGLEGIKTARNANNRDDTLWQSIRIQQLTPKEQRTYLFMDSLGEKRNLDAILGATEVLLTGLVPIGPLDLDLNQLLGFNELEKTRLGLGLQTSERISQRFVLAAYGAYGLGDEAWKYGVSTDFKAGLRKEIKIGLSYQNDLEEPSWREYPIRNSLFSSRNYAFRFDRAEKMALNLEGWFLPYTFFKMSLEKSHWQSQYDYQFGLIDEVQRNAFNFTELKLGIRYSHGERFTKMLGSRMREGGDYPVLQITYAKGLKDFLGGEFDYHRLLVNIEYTHHFKTFGETYFLLEGAWASAGLPYQKIFDTNGLGRDFRILLDDHTFHTMAPYEFLSNRFVEFFFRHNFKAIFGAWKIFRPELSLVHNLTFGQLDQPELHQDITFNTLEKGYYEAGLILDNIIGINYFNVGTIGLGLGGFYRYGPYQQANWKDNIGVQVTFNFDML